MMKSKNLLKNRQFLFQKFPRVEKCKKNKEKIMIKLINADYIFDEKEVKEIFKNADIMFQRGQLKTVDEEESFLKQELNDLYYSKLQSFA